MRRAGSALRTATVAVVALTACAVGPLTQAAQAAPSAGPACGVLAQGASAVAQSAIQAACGQIGVWYTWAGGHGPQPGATYGQVDPSDPERSAHDPERLGFDCSGLVRYAYAKATGQDILSGSANTQYHTSHASARFTADQGTGPLLPGDLLVWGGENSIHHIAIYLGAGKMVEAQQSDTRIMVSDVRLNGEYHGAVRIDGGPAQGGDFSTWSTGVWTHTQPSTTSPRVHQFAGPTSVRIGCQKHAQPVTAEGTTNDAWSYLPDYEAWITNIYIKGPAWLPGVPTCP
ncbi:C40 family peptidase [Streptomyces sp. RKAG337]|uniref:C40 family peptidase n=1 Tax=Streptomyces sp. RKAG337 TaxID=2893404 RepID=UPI00203378B2|nr:NlpC/P60 family protein [Streptomyces sp. RKAG337]MCM2424959.1 NlpC/P60 family protein [Streptomyces sp. RKAG337]